MEDYARQQISITLRCGFDLEANLFWKEMGYQCIGIVDGGIRRMRKINIWRKYLQNELIMPQIIEPVRGKTNATIWGKHKKLGITTGFNRGNKLKEYRMIVLENSSNLT